MKDFLQSLITYSNENKSERELSYLCYNDENRLWYDDQANFNIHDIHF